MAKSPTQSFFSLSNLLNERGMMLKTSATIKKKTPEVIVDVYYTKQSALLLYYKNITVCIANNLF